MSVSSSIGPISGINYGQLITGLTALDQQPIDQITTQVAGISKQSDALNSLAADLTGLQLSATSFTSSAIFNAVNATSSNAGVITATAGPGTAVGSYTFNVQRLAASSQLISQGYGDPNTTPLGVAGNLTFQIGGANLQTTMAKLTDLNGGAGVSRGSIRVTDRAGSAATIDLSQAVDLNDVVNAINNNQNVNLTASIQGDHLKLVDNSTGTGAFAVSNVGATTTAADLGLTGAAVGNTLTGTDVNKLALTTNLNALNGGLGVRTVGVLNDLAINYSGSSPLNVSLSGDKTVGDVLKSINAAGKVGGVQVVTAALSSDGHGITLTAADGGALGVTALNGSQAAQDLGLTGTSTAGVLTGGRLNSGLNSPLLSQLNGGAGVGLGTISITNHLGTATSVDLSSAKTVNDVISLINGAGAGVTAAVNSAGNGLALTDTTGATTGTLAVTDTSGTAAHDLGIAQSTANTTINGSDVHLRTISTDTQLSTLNGGAGMTAGKIQLTDSTGAQFTVDLSGSSITTIGDVITQINHSSVGIRASLNANGNGLLLTDSAGGTATPSVTEVNGGKTAASLGILGSFSNGKLDGSLEKTVAITATDTLQTVASKINLAGLGVNASIINDGSGSNPYRLALVSKNSGAAGRINFDGSALGITTSTLVQGQDAVVVYGSGSTGLTATSSTNSLGSIVPGLAVSLTGTGAATVSVGRDDSQIVSTVQGFVTAYNKVQSTLATVTKFNANDQTQNGVLFGNSTVEQVQQSLGQFISKSYAGVGSLTTLASVGISVGQDGTLTLDSNALQTALTNNPTDVRNLFTMNVKAVTASAGTPATGSTPAVAATAGSPAVMGIGATLNQFVSAFTDAQTGIIFRATDALATQTTELNSRSTFLNQLLTAKKNTLIQSFANLESSIAVLQNQGKALDSLTTTTSSTSSSSSSSG